MAFSATIDEAFRHCCEWFGLNRPRLIERIQAFLEPGCQMRHLVRKTRHYTVAMHAMNLPIVNGYQAWVAHIEEKFAASGSFVRNVSASLVECELGQMRDGDVPYFWTDPVKGGIWSGTDRLQISEPDGPICKRLKQVIGPPEGKEFEDDLERLSQFLEGGAISYYSQHNGLTDDR